VHKWNDRAELAARGPVMSEAEESRLHAGHAHAWW
jgi:hypothetical protein